MFEHLSSKERFYQNPNLNEAKQIYIKENMTTAHKDLSQMVNIHRVLNPVQPVVRQFNRNAINEDLDEVKLIKKWVDENILEVKERPKVLFVIGSTLTGKSVFIKNFLFRREQMELYNGVITFQNYVQDPRKLVRIFDDPNFKMMDWEDIKNLFNGQEMTMKVLYDYKQVNPLPLIIIMNVPEFHKFLEKNKEYIGWINSNSKFVEVKHKLWLEDKPYNDEEPYYDLELKKFVFFKFNSFMSRRNLCKSESQENNKMEIEKEPVLCSNAENLIIDLEKVS